MEISTHNALTCVEIFIVIAETILTSGGSLRGEEVEFEGIKFKSFKGIPYAAPPIKEKRFKDPQPAEIWDTIKDAVEFGHICYQAYKAEDIPTSVELSSIEDKSRTKDQSEDCLTLNVYTKKLGEEAAQPVLFWIHGGGFFAGDGTDDIFGPEFLVQQDLVVVTINYRLGPLGFLSTNTSDASGNWGLKDQVAALKWVQENIAQFGGDPKEVTLYGQSTGATSAHLHMLSPLSKGLFQRVILSSGTATCDWALTNDQERFSENLAAALGASEKVAEDPEKRVEFLRGVDAKKLSDGMWLALEEEDLDKNLVFPIPFLPVMEPDDSHDPFLVDEPWKAIIEGKFTNVPMMIGFNDNEAGFYMVLPRFKDPKELKEMDENLCIALPSYLRERVEGKGECESVGKQIRNFYFGGKSIVGQLENLTNLVSDSVLVHAFVFTQVLHTNHSKEVYDYYFSYDGEWNMMKKVLQKYFHVELPGAVHGDDMTYVFNPRLMKLPFREPTKAGLDTKARMLSFISNFVKKGNPTPAVTELVPFIWEPATENRLKTMMISSDIVMDPDFKVLAKRIQFWAGLYLKYDDQFSNLSN